MFIVPETILHVYCRGSLWFLKQPLLHPLLCGKELMKFVLEL